MYKTENYDAYESIRDLILILGMPAPIMGESAKCWGPKVYNAILTLAIKAGELPESELKRMQEIKG